PYPSSISLRIRFVFSSVVAKWPVLLMAPPTWSSSSGTGGCRRIPRPGGHRGRGSTAGRSSSRSSFPGQGDRGGERLLVDGVGFGAGQGPGEDVGAGTVPQRKGAGVSGPALDLDAGPEPGGAGGAPDGE